MYITLCGVDGSGKSTISRNLTIPNFTIVKEPYYKCNIDEIKRCNDVDEKIQLFASDRQQLFKELHDKGITNIISDRSIICNYVYQSVEGHLINKPLNEAITYIQQFQPTNIPQINHAFHIQASPETVTNRCSRRCEPMSIMRANLLNQRYIATYNILNIPYTILNTDKLDINDCIDEISKYIMDNT